jgi:proteasome assembly chaperone (PAC2) family protein
MVKALKAGKIATLYSPHFPNQVLAMKSGRLRLFSLGFYVTRVGTRDVILLRGDLQPLTVEGQFEVSAKILSFAKDLGCKEVLAMAGFATSLKKGKPARVFCSSTDKKLFEKMLSFGAVKGESVIPIVGMAGMLPALAKLYDLNGACLLVETSGTSMDSAGAKTLLDVLSKLLNQKFDYKQLDERVKKAEKMLKQFVGQQPSPTMQPPAMPEAVEKDVLRYIR